ncbi:MAG: SH3 domain-containing protein [Parvibaculum sp.]|nr:SH3 domain-containing protein [Parvibaculum sp.]
MRAGRSGSAWGAAIFAAAFFCAPLAGTGEGFVAAALAAERGGMPERTPGTATGLPVPRFVSLKSGRANVRRGPGTDFPIDWVYRKSGMPLEVIAESSNWRRIRDHEGDGGWIWHSMLDGERSAIVDTADGAPVALHTEPADSAPVIAYAEKGIVARVKSCKAHWCRLETSGYEGWAPQETLWGAYPGEEFE